MKTEALVNTRPSAPFTEPVRSGAGASAADTAPLKASHTTQLTPTAEAKTLEKARVFMAGKVPLCRGRFKFAQSTGKFPAATQSRSTARPTKFRVPA